MTGVAGDDEGAGENGLAAAEGTRKREHVARFGRCRQPGGKGGRCRLVGEFDGGIDDAFAQRRLSGHP